MIRIVPAERPGPLPNLPLPTSSRRRTLYPINPISLQKFREVFVVSRAKDDGKDAEYLARLLAAHHDRFQPWHPDTQQTRLLERLVVDRRSVVDHRTGLTNRLQAILSPSNRASTNGPARAVCGAAGRGRSMR